MLKTLLALTLAVAAQFAGAQVTTPSTTITLPDGSTAQVQLSTALPAMGAKGSASGVITMAPNNYVVPNAASKMKQRLGHAEPRVMPTPDPTSTDTDFALEGFGWAGSFRIDCKFSHMLPDDPLIYPGQPGLSHWHTFFGLSTITGLTDTSALFNSTEPSTCAGGGLNHSGYWVSSMVDMRNGNLIQPTANEVYYKEAGAYGQLNDPTQDKQSPGRSRLQIQPFPIGLHMLGGDPGNTSGNTYGSTLGQTLSYYYYPKWSCNHVNGSIEFFGNIPGNTCENGSEVIQLIYFPNCWDGVNLDSPDHHAHVAYTNEDDRSTGAAPIGCPASHPVPMPWLSYNVHYKVDANNRPENWRLSSDNYPLNLPGGGSSHGDYVYGWDRTTFLKIVNNCIKGVGMNQGLECHTNLLGDHTTLY